MYVVMPLTVKERIVMFREVYYVHPKVLCSYVIAAFQLFCVFLDVRGIAFLAVEGCLNAVFWGVVGHGKSPCFSGLSVLTAAGVDAGGLIFRVADGVFVHG
jgi:hypothetical protein